MRELISTLKKKKKKKRQAGNEWSNILPKSSQAREKATTLMIEWELCTALPKQPWKTSNTASISYCLWISYAREIIPALNTINRQSAFRIESVNSVAL